MSSYNKPIYKAVENSVLRDSVLHDPVTFNNQNDLNLIIDERIKYDREYILLDRDKVNAGITDPDQLLSIFDNYELEIFFKQALEFYYIDESTYLKLINDHTLMYDLILMNDIHELLFKQISYRTKIPSISDLEANGLLDSIIKVIQLHPKILIDKTLIQTYTEDILTEKLKQDVFISFEKIELILNKQSDILKIVTNQEIIDLLNRVKPYLSFVTDAKILNTQKLIDNNSADISAVFNANEIKYIIDKELELKNLILKAITPESLTILFNKFKTDLISTDLNPLIDLKIQILKDEMFGTNYDALISQQVDNYLTNTYNTLMKQTLNNAFKTFKTDFLNTDLKVLIQTYFDQLKSELLNQDYTGLVSQQVDNYLLNNYPLLTKTTVLNWITQELQTI